MKKQLILSAIGLLFATGAMAQTSNFQLKADLKNFGDTVLVYKRGKGKMDTILVKNNQFTYSAYVEKPAEWTLATPEVFRGARGKAANLIVMPNEQVELTGDIETRYDINGSKFYQEYHELDLAQEEAGKEMAELRKSINERMENGGNEAELRKEYQEKMPALEKAYNEKMLAFISQHPNYEACATLIGGLFYDMEDIEKVMGLLAENVKQGRMKDYYQPIIEQIKARQEAEKKAAKIQAAGADAPDFTLKDIKGNDFTLSNLRGKHVILDFWGSWCGWCIKGMPKMKEYYQKYAGKFEIVGVDCGDTDAKWKAAVEKHQLPWLHVFNARGDKDVSKLYAIQGYPTKIVVGPDGKIVKTIVGEDPAFYTLLDELFSK